MLELFLLFVVVGAAVMFPFIIIARLLGFRTRRERVANDIRKLREAVENRGFVDDKPAEANVDPVEKKMATWKKVLLVLLAIFFIAPMFGGKKSQHNENNTNAVVKK